MRRALTVIGLGMAGLALAISLSLGAFALAGRSLGEPATAVRISEVPTKENAGHDKASPSPRSGPVAAATQSPVDDHGGTSGDGGSGPSTQHDTNGSDEGSSGGDD